MATPKRSRTADPSWLPSLLAAMIDGTSLRAWCRIDGNPSVATVYNWTEDRDDIAGRIARARRIGAYALVEQAIAAVNGPVDANGQYDRENDDAVRVARDRLKADKLTWLAGVYDPVELGTDARQGQGSINITVVSGVPAASPRLTVSPAPAPQLPPPQEDNES